MPGNNTASAWSTVDTSADLSTAITAPSHVYTPSTTVTYTASLTNAGPSDAQAVVLTVKLPGTKVGHYVSNNAPAGVCSVAANNAGTTVTCNLGKIAAGAGTSVQVVYFFQGNQKIQTATDSVNSLPTDRSGLLQQHVELDGRAEVIEPSGSGRRLPVT